MPIECSADSFGFERVEGRAMVSSQDSNRIKSDPGALLLGATDRSIRLIDCFAGSLEDVRSAELIEHSDATLVGQRVHGRALGYENLDDP